MSWMRSDGRDRVDVVERTRRDGRGGRDSCHGRDAARPMGGPAVRRRPGTRASLLLALVAGLALCGCAQRQTNSVAAFLDGAERQTETPEFREEVRLALSDMLRLPPPELARKRYRDYDGMPGAWTAIELLERYFVPEQPATLDSATFYRDVSQPAARRALRLQLTAVEQALASDPPPDPGP